MVVDQNTKINFQVVTLIVTAAVSVGMMYQRLNNVDDRVRDLTAEVSSLNDKMDKYIFDNRIGQAGVSSTEVTISP